MDTLRICIFVCQKNINKLWLRIVAADIPIQLQTKPFFIFINSGTNYKKLNKFIVI